MPKAKKVLLTQADVLKAKVEGKPLTQVAKEKTKRKLRTVKPKFDWEALSKRLQEALAGEIVDGQLKDKEIDRLQTELIQASGIILYLEKRLGNHQV